MRAPDDFAGGKPGSAYCSTCGDETGQLKPYDEVLRANADYLVRQQGLDPGAARGIGPCAARQHARMEEPRLMAPHRIQSPRNPPCMCLP